MKLYVLFVSSALLLTAMDAQAESFWLILQNSTYRIEKIEMKKHVAMRVTRHSVHKKFGYSTLFVLNWQIRKNIQQNFLKGTTGELTS